MTNQAHHYKHLSPSASPVERSYSLSWGNISLEEKLGLLSDLVADLGDVRLETGAEEGENAGNNWSRAGVE